jgi:hypothetical protein
MMRRHLHQRVMDWFENGGVRFGLHFAAARRARLSHRVTALGAVAPEQRAISLCLLRERPLTYRLCLHCLCHSWRG